MALIPVNEAEVESAIRSLRPKKTLDIDGMSVWLLKQCSVHIVRPLTQLINRSFEEGVFPSFLKRAKIVPVF